LSKEITPSNTMELEAGRIEFKGKPNSNKVRL